MAVNESGYTQDIQRRADIGVYPAAPEATALGMSRPVTGVTGNTALIYPVPDAPK